MKKLNFLIATLIIMFGSLFINTTEVYANIWENDGYMHTIGAYNSENPYSWGQCTWYAWGRFYNMTGIKLPGAGDAGTWASDPNLKPWFTTNLHDSCIAILGPSSYSSVGHVVYIEKIEGNNVYITEGNYLGSYYHEDVRQLSQLQVGASYYSNGTGQVLGYLCANKKPETFKPSGSEQNLGDSFTALIVPKKSPDLALGMTGTTNGSRVTLNKVDYTAGQTWKFIKRSSGYYINNQEATNMYLDIASAGNKNTDTVYVWEKYSGTKNKWHIYNYNGGYRLVPESAKEDMLALDVYGLNFKQGATIDIYEAQGNDNQAQTFLIQKLPTKVSLNSTSISLQTGKTYTLKGTITPTDAFNKSVSFSSNNNSVASISSSGVVTAKSAGTAKITAKSVNGVTAVATITVTNPAPKEVPIQSVALNYSNATIKKGDTLSLKATINPSNTTQSKNITWSSNNNSVASVSTSGVVTAKSAGSATITAKTVNGKTATVKITVTNAITKITLNKASLNLTVGKNEELKATITPSGAEGTIIWLSENSKIATVDKNGKVSAVGAGTTVINVITSNGLIASCKVTVTAASVQTKPSTETNTGSSSTNDKNSLGSANTGSSSNVGTSTSAGNASNTGSEANKESSSNKGSSANGSTSNSKDKTNASNKEESTTLSNDNSIKELKIDGKDIEVSDNMSYFTNEDDIDLEVVLNDSKATYEVIKDSLVEGTNNVLVLVTAPDGTLKVYTILVTKSNIELSSNKNAKILVNDQEIKFIDNKSNLKVGYFTKNLEYKCLPEDEKSICQITPGGSLKVGQNKIVFKVKAEDHTSLEYVLNVNKTATMLYIIVGSIILGLGLITLIVFIIKRKKKNK